MLKRVSRDNQLLLITLVLVLLMGVPTFRSLMENNEEVTNSPQLKNASVQTKQRNPASITPEHVMAVRPVLSHFAEYDLNCGRKVLVKKEVAGAYIQFQGKNCLKNYKDGDVEILNKSNGYTASTFSNGDNKYQTDLIQLQNGDNEILIRYRESSGKSVEEVVRVHSTQI
ncbi:MAG: hypothetical protein ACXVC3_12980 [Bdellovibrio sp.]